MAEVVWLASYPKSGSTWVRALLAGYVGEGAFDLDRLSESTGVQGLRALGGLLGVDPLLLGAEAVAALRPAAARQLARDVADREGLAIQKVHSANVTTAAGERAFPAGAGRALVVVRNPLDVAASWAPYFGVSTDDAIATLADDATVLNPTRGAFQIVTPEPLLSWSGHAASWLDAPGVPVHVVRYEDLLADAAGALAGMLRFVGVEPEADRVATAVEAARFDRLRQREAEAGFVERPRSATAPFFRKGRAGSWRAELTPAQAHRVVADHADMMRRLGYEDLVAEVTERTPAR